LYFKITWLKDNKPLHASNRYRNDYDLNTFVASLKIDNAQLNDVGNYKVIAENEVGSDQTHCSVLITPESGVDTTPIVNPIAFRYLEKHAPHAREDAPEPKSPPKVVVPLRDLNLQEGQAILLACKIIGLPRPKVFLNKLI
jgi:hypothetical protein